MTPTLTAAQIRQEIGHPIVDADGHFMELGPIMNDEIVSYLEETGGARASRQVPQQPARNPRYGGLPGRPQRPGGHAGLALDAVVVGQSGGRQP